MKQEKHAFDFCVVGGGMAGLVAALAAARRGVRVALIHDRPVLGGNASSEIRMHICGAHGINNRETGILEEILLDQQDFNPMLNYAMWDALLYGKALMQPGLDLFLNCSVNACKASDGRIESVTGWQMTTETLQTIEAPLFADCSGDGILAPLSGAAFVVGREARETYGESLAPLRADNRTMGMSCLIQAREYTSAQPFQTPSWARPFLRPADLHNRITDPRRCNFWWIEAGGEWDVLHDAEIIRAELLKIAFGVWDYVKNRSDIREAMRNWALDWVGFLPGKRESRRYIGDVMLTQNDLEQGGEFEDIVAYGGWTLDDHFPAGFYHPEAGNVFVPVPSPFGIPYRSLYARDVHNLFCAGRCHSASHAALSATRVMGTTSLMGQAVGTAAALAKAFGLTPRGVYQQQLRALQQALMDDDAWLPGLRRDIPPLSKAALLEADAGDPEALRNGVDRPTGAVDNAWTAPPGSAVCYRFASPARLCRARLVFDSDLNRQDDARRRRMLNSRSYQALDDTPVKPPATLVKSFRLEAQSADGQWKTVFDERRNTQRFRQIPLDLEARALRLVPESTWGATQVRVFAFDVSGSEGHSACRL